MCASPMPVLPAVPSTTVPPGRNVPRRSAQATKYSAARSFTLPPPFIHSAFPNTVQPVASERPRSLKRGVDPTSPENPERTGPDSAKPKDATVDRPRRNLGLFTRPHRMSSSSGPSSCLQ